MTTTPTLAQLQADLGRWRERLPAAEGTYCQGIANKAFGELELLLKDLLERRLAASTTSLDDLLAAVDYTGNARVVRKLPPGTLVGVLLKLARTDRELADALTPTVKRALTRVVPARNKTTHEVLAPKLRARTQRLIDLIEAITSDPGMSCLLS